MFFLFFIAILNIALGYAVASYWHRIKFRGEMPIIIEGADEGEASDVSAKAADKSAEKKETQIHNSNPLAGPTCPLDDLIKNFQDELDSFHKSVVQIDTQARSCEDESEEYTQCVNDLKETNQQLLDTQSSTMQTISENQEHYQSHGELSESLMQAVQDQSATVSAVNDELVSLLTDGRENGKEHLIEQTDKLYHSANQTRDSFEDAALQVLIDDSEIDPERYDGTEQSIVDLSDQAKLHTILARWWADDPDHIRSLVLVHVDLDDFGKVNQQVGPEVANQLIEAVDSLIRPLCLENSGTLTRVKGKRFVLFLPDADPRTFARSIEGFRGALAQTKFKHQESMVELTASCAVIGVMPKDTSETLLTRAEEAITEVKENGRNQTYLHEGKYPTPFTIEDADYSEKVIEL